LKRESIGKAIGEVQEDYMRRKKTIEDYIPQSGITDILQQRIFDYRNFIRTLESLKEAILEKD